MKDSYARKILKDIVEDLGREIVYSGDADHAYTRNKSYEPDKIGQLCRRDNEIWDELIALKIRVCDMEEAAKPTCKKCGQKVVSVKRTGKDANVCISEKV